MLCTIFRSNFFGPSTRLSLGLSRVQNRSLLTSNIIKCRGYATSRPSTKPNSAPKLPPNATSPRRTAPRPNTLSLEEVRQLRKIEQAEKMFNAGNKLLYQATSRTTRFRVSSWGLALLAGSGIYFFWVNNLLDIKYYQAIGHDHPNLMLFAFMTTSCFLGAALGWSAMKSVHHVDRIDLVRNSGAIFLQITVRRPVPFLKRSFVVRARDVKVDDRVVAMMSIPESLIPTAPSEASPSAFTLGVIRETLRSVSRFFYNFFDTARVFFSQEGIITIDVSTKKGDKEKVEKYYMDAGSLFFQEDNEIVLWDLVDAKDRYA